MTMTVPPTEANALAVRLMGRVMEIVAADITASMPKPKPPARDRAVMAACREVGAAVDRLEQAKFGPGEIPARKALERSAKRLRTVLERHSNART
ncbi:MAG: hypothetical protein EOQ98_19290 [Mesorhizobium sp.]|uniref:hypothetical protein n=1 Tax=Mesorhizobium sp. TaxID=1871066 RepID=UPI000FD1C2AA|nr:hypothetical protein [Mesorhizobium sp.]RUU24988.1 hypothetical protein EOD08_23965 [Mesorhizobium sp. M6A.T.Ca.TU.002.02.2.1]RWO97179.1 MAG: hypothetical protein EOQ98_19290 [Mesorhizobium sp.]TIM52603.1 MAG: hypothetical protein E5Y69_00855 [Mesorhizobium sp.]